jgi:phosphonate C-P lyase system protein PhnH
MTTVADHLASAIVAARLNPQESQIVFRRLLDTLARPGRLGWLPADVARRVPPALVPLLALCDLEVTCCVVESPSDGPSNVAWAEVVASATGARTAPLHEAGWIAALGHLAADHVAGLRRGSTSAPEHGARLSVACRELHIGAGEQPWSATEIGTPIVTIDVRGPGVPDRRCLTLSGVTPEVIDALRDANAHLPAGVDTWFVADSGAVIALSRTTRVTVIASTVKGAF